MVNLPFLPACCWALQPASSGQTYVPSTSVPLLCQAEGWGRRLGAGSVLHGLARGSISSAAGSAPVSRVFVAVGGGRREN